MKASMGSSVDRLSLSRESEDENNDTGADRKLVDEGWELCEICENWWEGRAGKMTDSEL